MFVDVLVNDVSIVKWEVYSEFSQGLIVGLGAGVAV